jgi:CubicO group peptidase (beta-lactamase class C family)
VPALEKLALRRQRGAAPVAVSVSVMRRGRWVLTAIVTSAAIAGCGGGGDENAVQPVDRYPLAAAQSVDARGLDAARAALASNANVRCLLVERNGVLVMEEYFNGAGANDFFDVRSVTKTVTSMLVGIAIERGDLRGLDQTVGDLLGDVVPDLAPETRRVTLRQLLTMTSGLPWRELNSVAQDYSAWVGSPDPLRWILAKPLEHEPGTFWHYNTGASHIPSAMLSVATGASARAFAQEHLFGPLDAEIGGWPADPRGYNFGGHGISLQGRTLVKLGRLFLDGGVYRGRQIVPRDWVRESTIARSATTNDAVTWASGYGYFWWLDSDARTGRSVNFAAGYGGQFIVVVPSANATVVATTAWNGVPDADANFMLVLRTIVSQVLPSLG